MKTIELDGSNWHVVLDFYDALLLALEAPEWHGKNLDALVDTMIWEGINGVEAPYTVRIVGLEDAPREVRDHVERTRNVLAEAREDRRNAGRGDVAVTIEVFTGH